MCYTCYGVIKMNVGEKIREIRKSKNLSQKQLGERLGVSQAMIAQYENGDRNPKFETLLKIADALGVYIGKLDDSWGTDLSNPSEYEKFKSRLETFEANLNHMNETAEIMPKIPGEIVLEITQENFEKYRKYFIFVCKNIFDDFMDDCTLTITEQGFYDADTGEKKQIEFDNLYEMFLDLDDEHKFLFLQDVVDKIIINPILNTYSFTLKK